MNQEKELEALFAEPQTPTNYVAIRVLIVHVKKGLLGLKDSELGKVVCIPDTRKEVLEAYNRVKEIVSEGREVIDSANHRQRQKP